MLAVVHYFAIATTFATLIASNPINDDLHQAYTLNDKPSHPSEKQFPNNNDQILNLAEESNVSRGDENIPLIVFEANVGNHSDIEDCSGYNNVDCSDRDLEVDLIDSNELESLQQQQQTEPSSIEEEDLDQDQNQDQEPQESEDQIQLKTTNGDSDTVFFISNTEVKMLDTNPTTQRESSSFVSSLSVENFAIDVTSNFTSSTDMVTTSEVLKEERGGNFINTPIVHFINKMNRHNFSAVELPKSEKPNATQQQQQQQEVTGNITTLTVIDESVEGGGGSGGATASGTNNGEGNSKL